MAFKIAMILAAGRGERMRPLTDNLPKPLLEIHGKTLIEYHLEALKKSGYQRVVINHAWLGHKIEEHIGDGHRFGLEVLYSVENQALETAGGIINALPLLFSNKQRDPHKQECQKQQVSSNQQASCFTVVNGDVFTDFNFSELPVEISVGSAHLVLVNNPQHNPTGDFFLVDQRLQDSGEQKLTFSGIAQYHKDFFAGQIDLGESPNVKPLAPMLRKGISAQKITGQYHQGTWTDVGTPQRLEQLNR